MLMNTFVTKMIKQPWKLRRTWKIVIPIVFIFAVIAWWRSYLFHRPNLDLLKELKSYCFSSVCSKQWFAVRGLETLNHVSGYQLQYSERFSLVCRGYNGRSLEPYYVWPYVYNNCISSVHSVSLVIQITSNYLDKLPSLFTQWKGPMSVAIFIQAGNTTVLQELDKKLSLMNWKSLNACLHVVLAATGYFYPVNILRNVATTFALTEFVLVVESDFIPMADMAMLLSQKLSKSGVQEEKHTAYVIPVFGRSNDHVTIPRNKNELSGLWSSQQVLPIHETREFKAGHEPTKYEVWRTATMPYQVPYVYKYEPYYVVSKNTAPHYPQEFQFGYFDKGIHAYLLKLLDFKFLVLPDVFLLHTSHFRSKPDFLMSHCGANAVANLNESLKVSGLILHHD